MAGLLVIVTGLVAVLLITNGTRISSNTGTRLIDDGSKTQKRSACITDLRNLVENFAGQETDAVLNRLAVLDGYDPTSKHKIHTVVSATGKRVADPNIQTVLSYKYVQEGLAARDKRQKVALLLTQPTLNHICGKPVINKNEDN